MVFPDALTAASLLLRSTLLVLTGLYIFSVNRRSEERGIKFLILIPIVYLLRDLLYTFIPSSTIIVAAELGVLFTYYLIIRSFLEKQPGDQPILVVNAVLLLLGITNAFVGFLPGWIWRIDCIVLMIDYALLGMFFYQITVFNTEDPELMTTIRNPVFVSGIVFYAVLFFPGFDTFITKMVFMPAFYIIPLFVAVQYDKLHMKRLHLRISTLDANLDSVLSFMKQIGKAISEKLDIQTVLEDVAESAMKDVNADGSAIFMVDEFEDILNCRAHKGIYPPPYPVSRKVATKLESMFNILETTPLKPGETIIGETAKSGESVYIRNTADDPRMEQNTHHDALFIQSFIAVPLVVNNTVLGILSVCHRKEGAFFSQDDFEHIKTFAEYTSLTINNLFLYMELLEKQELDREVGIAADIQTQLLPQKLPSLPEVSFAAFSRAARGVSGDYYDVIHIKKTQKLAVVICDVAGKGIPASLVMVMIRTIFYLIAGSGRDADTIVSWINKGIAGKIAMDRFATLSFLIYDIKTGTIEYSNAAHHPLLVYRADADRFEELDTKGIPIGLERKTNYEKITTDLQKNDIIVNYTDGIIEAMDVNSRQYGIEALKEVVRNYAKHGPEAISDAVQKDVNHFAGRAPQHDDQTLLIMKVNK